MQKRGLFSMRKLKKLLIVLCCLSLAACSAPASDNGSTGEPSPNTTSKAPQSSVRSDSEPAPESSKVKQSSAGSKKSATSSRASSAEKNELKLGKLLLNGKFYPDYQSDWETYEDSAKILQLIRTQTDLNFSAISGCKGSELYLFDNGRDYCYSAMLTAPYNQSQAVLDLLNAADSDAASWHVTNDPVYFGNSLEYELAQDRKCIEYKRSHKRGGKTFWDEIVLIQQKPEIEIYIERTLAFS